MIDGIRRTTEVSGWPRGPKFMTIEVTVLYGRVLDI